MTPPRRLDEARLALMLLTVIPAGRLKEPAPSLADAAWAYPLVGIVTGTVGWAVFAGLTAAGAASVLAALLAVGAVVAVTGGLHHDGLADFADALGGRDAARRLEIMRDSRIGTYGVLALIFAVTLSVVSVSGLGGRAGWSEFALIGTGSRLAMLAALVHLPRARTDGLGHHASGVKNASLLPGGVALVGLALLTGTATLPALAAIALSALAVSLAARRLLGGQTGDVLGTVQLTSEVTAWVAFAVVL
ncbi:adenosylcobinamide-GDP ribazoletransferase [Alphaproteobacteria bacterium GH1-50]|uniref:Adenosylcobinamide-GDP ribazoletransferase n=1 Tax=Kangsaoukella pontilimi TaxID=2691042 RepID=A0A7C9IJP9_9RHOB|nr:adenosylcobinamide-GDP ribazoletransferase [Kangsaoukella pontilimi]MXQ09042.1 adenosylcobinamide-GDP ribazoletransferase [Kangsaoukella pontilimi]